MRRTGIFCLYTPSGKVDTTIIHTLKALREVVEYLIIVVNGYIERKNDLSNYADAIHIRENVGFDVGAYTDIILYTSHIEQIVKSDELVLCNSSFYGPFISFKRIFNEMENSDADFWGISSSEKNLIQHIQSYFLVFRRSILESGELFQYLGDRVDKKELDYFSVCSIYENGLFWTLKNAGYRFDAYRRNIVCDNYLNPYGSVKIDGIPVLKRKMFSKEFYQRKKAVSALAYVKKTYHYDIGSILENAFKIYGIDLTNEMIEAESNEVVKKDLLHDNEMVTRGEIERFISVQKKVFIYGCGMMARMVFSCFFFYEDNPCLEGFVVSDNQTIIEKYFQGYPIYKFSEIKNRRDVALVVALNRYNTKEVYSQLKCMENVKFLWKC